MKKIRVVATARCLLPAALLLVLLSGFPTGAEAAPQETFVSPERAGSALVEANKGQQQEAALLDILGPEAKDLIQSGDPVADRNARRKFAAAYDARHAWESGGENDVKVLVVGAEKWSMPIPLVREDGKWRFDTAAGRKEILHRRIRRNEQDVINVCRAYVEAQEDYADEFPGKHEYAQKFRSTPGAHDGLYWPLAAGAAESPLGDLIASAEAEGYKPSPKRKHAPYHGYYYRILKAQSASAHGGARGYVVKGRMTGGFALLAFPAKYGASGKHTFIVNQTGIVHQKDLGPQTVTLAPGMTKYDPDKTWTTP